MAEQLGDHDSTVESMLDQIKGKIADGHDSSSSDSDDDIFKAAKVQAVKSKIYRLFGREQPIHKVFGGGKPADILLWRDKKVSGRVLGGATIIWTLFELLEYHLITLVCHALMLFLAVFFVWSNAANFLNKSPPKIPDVVLPEKCVLEFASQLRVEVNRGFAVLHDIASGRDLKKFLAVIFGLWILSIIGNSCNFLTLFYITFVLLFTVPYAYEKYEDQVDPIAEKAIIEIKKQYAVFDEKLLSKIPKGPLKDKKKD